MNKAAAMAEVLRENPELGIDGFRLGDDDPHEFATGRAEMLSEGAVAIFEAALQYLESQNRRPDVNPALYTERCVRCFADWLSSACSSVAEIDLQYRWGLFTAAAIHLGIPACRIPHSRQSVLGLEIDPTEKRPTGRARSECTRSSWAAFHRVPLHKVGFPPDDGTNEFEEAWPDRVQAGRVRQVWSSAVPARADHPFFVHHQIENHGLRATNWKCHSPWTGETIGEVEEAILMPMWNEFCEVISLMALFPDCNNACFSDRQYLPSAFLGTFLRVGAVLPADTSEPLVIAETYPAAATIHASTGFTVLTAFDAFNLEPVAKLARRRKPRSPIIVAAGDDRWPSGTSRSWRLAKEAAKAVEGHLATPAEPLSGDLVSDFNTQHRIFGDEAVKGDIRGAVDWWF